MSARPRRSSPLRAASAAAGGTLTLFGGSFGLGFQATTWSMIAVGVLALTVVAAALTPLLIELSPVIGVGLLVLGIAYTPQLLAALAVIAVLTAVTAAAFVAAGRRHTRWA